MTKQLTITYGDAVLYDGAPETFNFSEADNGTFQLRAGPARPGFFDQVKENSRQKTQRKRAQLEAAPPPGSGLDDEAGAGATA